MDCACVLDTAAKAKQYLVSLQQVKIDAIVAVCAQWAPVKGALVPVCLCVLPSEGASIVVCACGVCSL